MPAFTGLRLSMRALLQLAVGPWPPAAWAWPVALLWLRAAVPLLVYWVPAALPLAASMGEDYAQFVLVECSRLLAFLDVATDRCPHEGAILVRKAAEAVQRGIAGIEEDVEKENGKGNRKDGKLLKQLKKGLGYLTSTLKQIEKMQRRLGTAGEGEPLNSLPASGDE